MLSQYSAVHQIVVKGEEEILKETVSILTRLMIMLTPYAKISREHFPSSSTKAIQLDRTLWLLENGNLASYDDYRSCRKNLPVEIAARTCKVDKIIDHVSCLFSGMITNGNKIIANNIVEIESLKEIANMLDKIKRT